MRYPCLSPENACNKVRVHTYRSQIKLLILYAMSYPLVLYCKSGRDFIFYFYLFFCCKEKSRSITKQALTLAMLYPGSAVVTSNPYLLSQYSYLFFNNSTLPLGTKSHDISSPSYSPNHIAQTYCNLDSANKFFHARHQTLPIRSLRRQDILFCLRLPTLLAPYPLYLHYYFLCLLFTLHVNNFCFFIGWFPTLYC